MSNTVIVVLSNSGRGKVSGVYLLVVVFSCWHTKRRGSLPSRGTRVPSSIVTFYQSFDTLECGWKKTRVVTTPQSERRRLFLVRFGHLPVKFTHRTRAQTSPTGNCVKSLRYTFYVGVPFVGLKRYQSIKSRRVFPPSLFSHHRSYLFVGPNFYRLPGREVRSPWAHRPHPSPVV